MVLSELNGVKFPITLSFRAEDAALVRFEVLASASFIRVHLQSQQGHGQAQAPRSAICSG